MKVPGGLKVLVAFFALIAIVHFIPSKMLPHDSHHHAHTISAVSLTHNERVAKRIAARKYHWKGRQWHALYHLWMGESGFRQNAMNSKSGAYGIPQSLPAGKMASAGPNWRTSVATQIRWGLRYIKRRYGDPVNAYAFWLRQNPHWY